MFKKVVNSSTRSLFGNITKRSIVYLNPNIRLLVCDMAGTTVNEHGIVYDALYDAIKSNGCDLTFKDMDAWHGVFKLEVIGHFVDKSFPNSKLDLQAIKDKINLDFSDILEEKYFGPDSKIALMDEKMPEFLENLRMNNVKVALNTGYPIKLQRKLI